MGFCGVPSIGMQEQSWLLAESWQTDMERDWRRFPNSPGRGCGLSKLDMRTRLGRGNRKGEKVQKGYSMAQNKFPRTRAA